MRAIALIFACVISCCAQSQDNLSRNWQARLARIKLYSLGAPLPSAGFLLPQNFQTTISWQGVEDRDTTPTYTRRGGANIPMRVGHIIAASLMALSATEVISVQSQPFRPVDRIAIRPDQLYYRYRQPWQPVLATLRNSARRNLADEFGPDIRSLLRVLSVR